MAAVTEKLPPMDVADLRQIAFIARRMLAHVGPHPTLGIKSRCTVATADIEALRQQFDGAGIPYTEQEG